VYVSVLALNTTTISYSCKIIYRFGRRSKRDKMDRFEERKNGVIATITKLSHKKHLFAFYGWLREREGGERGEREWGDIDGEREGG
jgi:hypothetical protein